MIDKTNTTTYYSDLVEIPAEGNVEDYVQCPTDNGFEFDPLYWNIELLERHTRRGTRYVQWKVSKKYEEEF